MDLTPTQAPDVAEFVSDAEARLTSLIHVQFRFLTVTAVVAVFLLLGTFAFVSFLTASPKYSSQLQDLRESNRELSTIANELLGRPEDETEESVLRAIAVQASAHDEAISAIEAGSEEPSSETRFLVQLIGGAGVLVLVGGLGLQRLQHLDSEVNNLRESIFAQMQARAKDIQDVVGATMHQSVRKELEGVIAQIEGLQSDAANTQEGLRAETAKMREDVNADFANVSSSIKEVLEKYPWLTSPEQFASMPAVANVSSVEQAHSLAVSLNASNDRAAAREALRKVAAGDLDGAADDFHNSHVEAMRMNDASLGLQIVEMALRRFPDQYDLVADRVNALRSVGRDEDARVFIEDWRKRKPDEFSRGWRPVVFYVELFRNLDLTTDAVSAIKALLEEVTSKLPYEIKPWTAYATFLQSRGNVKEAEELLGRALQLNPLSQQLHYTLGELLLRQGRLEDATNHLESALRVDYQDQYQHDVNQFAVRATLAQAYEALGKNEKAKLLYISILLPSDRDHLHRTIKRYALSRLESIALQEGKLLDPSNLAGLEHEDASDTPSDLGTPDGLA